MDEALRSQGAEIAARAERELEALVAVSSPSGDIAGAEEALAVCAALLPAQARIDRVPCSTEGGADDLVATIDGTGTRRVLLVGHIDTVIDHPSHKPLRRQGERLYGPGVVDMKGGVILSLGVARALATRPERFRQLSVLLVTDEEWRVQPFVHVERFSGHDACLCFEGGQLAEGGHEGVVVRRKAAGTLRVKASGRAAHSGSAPDRGRNALLALARTALRVASCHDPAGPQHLSVVPTVVKAGHAFNVVPAHGEVVCDMRADSADAFAGVRASVPETIDEVALQANMERVWPSMDCTESTQALVAAASRRLGREICAVSRGGASDASHFAAAIPLTIDGLGPRGGAAHSPDENVLACSLSQRAEVALALALEALSD